jgi:putative membrane protein
MDEALVRSLHFISIFTLVAALITEHMLLKPKMTPSELAKLARVDMIYGIAAILVLIAGLLLWMGVGKPSAFYLQNPLFHIKFTLFIVIALLSIYPTVFFIKNRKATQDVILPRKIIMFNRIQLTLVFIMPIFASLMSRGIGLSS